MIRSVLLLAGLSIASPATAATPIVHVAIRDHTFVPRVVHARVGQSIVWRNEDQDPHTVTSGTGNAGDGRWKSSPLIPDGSTFELALHRAGTYPYFCKPHQFQDTMHGTIVVRP